VEPEDASRHAVPGLSCQEEEVPILDTEEQVNSTRFARSDGSGAGQFAQLSEAAASRLSARLLPPGYFYPLLFANDLTRVALTPVEMGRENG